MTRTSRACHYMLCLALAMLPLRVLAHPAEGYEPNDLWSGYGTKRFGEPAEWSFGELVFSSPYPSPQSLSDIEKYMLVGTRDSWVRGAGLGPWWEDVMFNVLSYDKKYGVIPDDLSLAALESLSGGKGRVDSRSFARLCNPLTDKPVKLRSRKHSPGNLFVKRLTQAELGVLSRHDHLLSRVLAMNELSSPVYYVRLYGREGVILSRLWYTLKH